MQVPGTDSPIFTGKSKKTNKFFIRDHDWALGDEGGSRGSDNSRVSHESVSHAHARNEADSSRATNR